MTWAQIDDAFYDHPKYAELELEDFGLLACMIAYCNRHLTDGFIPESAIRKFGKSGSGLRSAKKMCSLKRPILRQSEDMFEIIGYLDHNPSRAKVLADRAAKSEQRREAGRSGGVKSGEVRAKQTRSKNEANAKRVASGLLQRPASSSLKRPASFCLKQTNEANEALSSPLRSSPLLLIPPDPPRGSDESGVFEFPKEAQPKEYAIDRYRARYETGIAKGKGGTFGMPLGQDGDLHTSILKHAVGGTTGKPLAGDRLLEWIELGAEEFARWLCEQDPNKVGVYSSFGPRGFLKWLNEQSQRDEAKRVG